MLQSKLKYWFGKVVVLHMGVQTGFYSYNYIVG
jgi:hypothetical protein